MPTAPAFRLSLRWKIAGLVAGTTLGTAALHLWMFAVLHPDAPEGAVLKGVLGAIVITAVSTGLALLFARRLARPIELLRDAASAIAAGDLRRTIPPDSTTEIAELAQSFGAMLKWLTTTVTELRDAAARIEQGATDIEGSVSRQAAMVAEQAAAITETSTTASEISQTSRQATEHADSVIQMTQRSEELSEDGLATVEQAVKASANLGEQVNRIAATMAGLSERTQQVSEIIASVKDLAEQSNLLALNASIEASKAGEHGRGFTVVALEMRTLAEQSKEAAIQIRAILQEIQRGARDAAIATDEGAKRATAAMELARSAGEAIEGLALVIKESSVAARQIANNTRQQTIGVDQMVQAIQELSTTISASAQGASDIQKGTKGLGEISRRLGESVSRYRV
jgi:methyl-accepting chemotaxis protein